MYDIIVIGCGVIGAALAHELSHYHVSMLVLEKENDVACATSKANSGILHAGYDPAPGTLMAKLNVEGAELLKGLCAKLDVPYRQCGSLALAFSEEDRKTLDRLYQQGTANGVSGMEWWDSDTLRRREPSLSQEALNALYAPTTAITSPWELTLALAETAVRNGVDLRLEHAVEKIERMPGGYRIYAGASSFDTRFVLNAAGLGADYVHKMVAPCTFQVIPDRGEYYLLDKSEGDMVSHVVFQCPTDIGKGTLIAPTVHGNLLVGPSNAFVADRDDVATTREGLRKVEEMARKLAPGVNIRANIRNFSGVRAASTVDDFIIREVEGAPGFVDVAGIKSPGLTAAPAVAQYVRKILQKCGLGMEKKKSCIGGRNKIRFAGLSPEEKQLLVKARPDYGRAICRCESVTEGEILDALASPIPPRSLEAVKRRTGAGMGRCQSGFCGPRIVEILARELSISPLDVPLDRKNSRILVAETKAGVFKEGDPRAEAI